MMSFTLLHALQYISLIQVMTCPHNATYPHPYNHTRLLQITTQYQIQYKSNNVRKTTRLNTENTVKILNSRTPSN